MSSTAKRSFYEKKVVELLSKMKLGKFNLTLPNGELVAIGDGKHEIVANIKVNDNYFFKRCVLYGDIGFAEAYIDGDWETDNIANVIKWFLLNADNAPTVSGSQVQSFALNMLKIFNRAYHNKRSNSLSGSKKNISEHYDLHNDFFALFLDPTMTYSCAYFKDENMDLYQAQIEKYDRLCKQLNLKPTDHVLEIGSGWGHNAIHIAKNYGSKVTTVTISQEQYKLATERIKKENLTDKVTVLLKDYRLIEGKFDKIVSIEMLEAVGHKFLEAYFRKCNELLKKDGILAIQVITCPDSRYESLRTGVDFIQKHIFPGSLLPSVGIINKMINKTSDMTMVDLKDMGLHYSRTLALWHEQFNQRLDDVKKMGFDERFIRKWNYYLNYCEAAFKTRNINVMQMVYARPNNVNR